MEYFDPFQGLFERPVLLLPLSDANCFTKFEETIKEFVILMCFQPKAL